MSTPTPPPARRGPLGGHTISRAAERVLRRELDAWSIPEGLGSIVSWDATPSMEALSVADLPAGAITVPGLADSPVRRSDGYSGDFLLDVGVFCRAPETPAVADPDGTREQAEDDQDADDAGWTRTYEATALWAAAVRTVILRHLLAELRGIATAVTWTGEDLAAARPSGARTLGGAAVSFRVSVPNLDDVELRPDNPDGTPATPRPRVGRVRTATRLVVPGRGTPEEAEDGADVVPVTEVPATPSG